MAARRHLEGLRTTVVVEAGAIRQIEATVAGLVALVVIGTIAMAIDREAAARHPDDPGAHASQHGAQVDRPRGGSGVPHGAEAEGIDGGVAQATQAMAAEAGAAAAAAVVEAVGVIRLPESAALA